MQKKYNIIYNSNYPWSSMMSRYTSIALALAKSDFINELIYLNPIRHLGDLEFQDIYKERYQIGRYAKIKDDPINIYASVSPILFRRYKLAGILFKRWSKSVINSITQKIPNENRVLLLQGPSEYTLIMLEHLKEMGFLTIFDWGDLYEKHEGSPSEQYRVAQLCRMIASKSDIVLGVSSYITELAMSVNKNSYTLTNASWSEQLATAHSLREGNRLTNPTICYFGLISHIKLNYPLIREVAKRRPEWRFVFIGPCTDPIVDDNGQYIKNIEITPTMDGKSLHEFIQESADICFIPYNAEDEPSRACSPLKLYEALGDGLPVVSTDVFDARDAKELIRFGNSPNELISVIENELATDSIEKKMKRIEYAKKNTWDVRIGELERIIETLDKK